MALHQDQHFQGKIIPLDNEEYKRCTFKRCTFQYRGLIPVTLDGFSIEDSRLDVLEYAANTVMVLKELRKTQLKASVDQILGLHSEEQS